MSSASFSIDDSNFPLAKLVNPETTKNLTSNADSDAGFLRMLEQNNIYLNEKQLAAARHVDGPCLTVAGAGTGKTTVLAARTAYLLSQEDIHPANIMLVTFTRKAALEMKERINRLVSADISKMVIGTFHSVFLRILKRSGLKEQLLSNPLHKQSIFRNLLKEMGLSDSFEPEEGMAIVSSLKVNLMFPSDGSIDEDVRNIWQGYEDWKTENNYIDFDDILIRTYELLRTDTVLLSSLQRRFEYILVDEFQDTNRVQYEVMRLLAAPQNNLFVVGDPDQTIYSFAGADVEIILGFQKMYPAAEIVKLDVNYRSTTHIVGLGNAVIKHNKSRIPNTLHVVKSSSDMPIFVQPPSSEEEAEFCVQQVFSEVGAGSHVWRDYAVLYRTSATSQALIEKLLDDDIPFIDHTDQKSPFFYDTSAVRPIMSLLRLSLIPNSMTDIQAVLPSLYMKRDEGMDWIVQRQAVSPKHKPLEHLYDFPGLADFRRIKLQENIDRLEGLSDLSPVKAIQLVRPEYEAFAFQRKGNVLTNYKDTIKEALDTLEQLASRHSTVAQLIGYVDSLKQKYENMQKLKAQPNPDAINLMTIHKSKGLEFPVVWAIGFSDGVLPHQLALDSKNPRDMFVNTPKSSTSDPMLEEERRLAYVCITRARDELIISSPTAYRGKKTDVSRFLREALLPPMKPKPARPTYGTRRTGGILVSSHTSSSPSSPVNRYLHEVLAWVCTSETCLCWKRIVSYEDANMASKTCPVCGQPMVQQSKEVSDVAPE